MRDDDIGILILALALVAASGWDEDPVYLEMLFRRVRERLQRSERWDPELEDLFMYLIHAPRRRFRRHAEETREIATSVLEGFRRVFETSITERLAGVDEELTTLREGQDSMRAEISSIDERLTGVGADLRSFVWAASTGVDFARWKIVRYVPIRIYVGDPVPGAHALDGLVAALCDLGNALGFQRAEELPEESGSWFKRLFLKTKRALTHDEVQQTLAKAKIALEERYLDKPQAEVTDLLANAAAKLINALSLIPGPCCGQAGSLLVVKLVGADGTASVVFKTLTPVELKRLEENAAMLQRPNDILGWLEQVSSTSLDGKSRSSSSSTSAELSEPK